MKTVDAEGDVGGASSLALDSSGNPRISYYDGTNNDLKYAWAELSPVPTPIPTPSGSASFAAYPQSGPAPHLVQFLDYTPNAKEWRWDFGDCGSSTLQYPTHQYNQSGLYSVSVTVTDWAGVTSTKTEYHFIRVSDPVTPTPTPVAAFTDASTGNLMSWRWGFGWLAWTSARNPGAFFRQPGEYAVSLTATSAFGSSTATKNLTVTGTTPRSVRGSSVSVVG